jgi:hypothetical protein
MTVCGHPSFEDAAAINPELGGFGSAALRYQQMGCAVLPLERGGKKPHRMLPFGGAGHDGVHWADRDARLVPWAWRDRDPAANVGVATGQVSHLLVIDLDVKGKHNGIEGFREFLDSYRLKLSDYQERPPVVVTPSGGQHIWLRTPSGLAVPERPGILPGVDVKGDGGLVVAPPSRLAQVGLQSPGSPAPEPVLVPYLWDTGCPCSVPEAPEWVFEWLAWSPPAPPGQPASGAAGAGGMDFAHYAAHGVPYGERNVQLYKLACSRMRYWRGDVPAVTADIRTVWEAGDKTDFGWREVMVIIESARKFHENAAAHDRELANRWRSRSR